MIYLELFYVFALIGVTSFGGMSMVPLINAQMISHGWMSAEEVIDIVAIAEMTPGALGLNCASFAGMRVAGIPGAIAANLGVLAPTFIITCAACIFIERFRNSRGLQNAMYGIRPVCIGMLISILASLLNGTVVVSGTICWQALLIIAIVSLLMWKTKLNIPVLIGISAVLGYLLY